MKKVAASAMLAGLASARIETNSASSLSAGGVCKYWEIYLQIVQLVIISNIENKNQIWQKGGNNELANL